MKRSMKHNNKVFKLQPAPEHCNNQGGNYWNWFGKTKQIGTGVCAFSQGQDSDWKEDLGSKLINDEYSTHL